MNSGTELARQIPNMNVSVLGNEDQPKFSMRGWRHAAVPAMATITHRRLLRRSLSGAQSMRAGAQLFDWSVESARPPVGKLFGKETVGGAVSFITRAPAFDNEGYLSAEYGNNGYLHLDGAANAELVQDRLAVRLAGDFDQSDGFVENLFPGGRDKSSIDKLSFRGSLRFDDGEGFDATLRLFTTRSSPEAMSALARLRARRRECLRHGPRVNAATGERMSSHEGVYDREDEASQG